MADTIEFEDLEEINAVDPSNDVVLGYSKSGNKVGLIPLSFVSGAGWCGRRWDMNASTPIGEACGDIDLLREWPSRIGLGCYLVDKNHGRRKLDPSNHYKFATGETAKLDGSMGDYMWGWNAVWYYAWWVDGDYFYEAVSLKPMTGRYNYKIPVASTSALGVAVVDRTNLELVSVINTAAQYRGGNNNADYDGKYNTQLGVAATNLNAATFGDYARKKGDGWEAYWYAHHAAIGILFRVIMGTRNCQTAVNTNKDSNGLYQGGVGAGVTTAPALWGDTVANNGWANYPFLQTSVAVDKGDYTGSVAATVTNGAGTTSTVNVPCFFGLKNFFGYLGRWGRGKLINKTSDGGYDMYVVPKLYSTYSMSSLTGLTKVASGPANATASSYEYITQMSMQNLCMCPTVLGGTSSTYFCDAQYNDKAVSGLRVPSVGGNANNGSNAGLGYLNVNNGVTTANANYGSPLNYRARRLILVSFSAEPRHGGRDRAPRRKTQSTEVPVGPSARQQYQRRKADKNRNDTEVGHRSRHRHEPKRTLSRTVSHPREYLEGVWRLCPGQDASEGREGFLN